MKHIHAGLIVRWHDPYDAGTLLEGEVWCKNIHQSHHWWVADGEYWTSVHESEMTIVNQPLESNNELEEGTLF